MNRKKTLITWAILLAVEAAIVLVVAGFELGSRGGGAAAGDVAERPADDLLDFAVVEVNAGPEAHG